MPTYDYECRSCGHRVEVIHAMTAEGPTGCDRCGGPMRRVLHPAGIIFRGSGFYTTDSRSATTPAGGAPPAAKPATGEATEKPASGAAGGDGASGAAPSAPGEAAS